MHLLAKAPPAFDYLATLECFPELGDRADLRIQRNQQMRLLRLFTVRLADFGTLFVLLSEVPAGAPLTAESSLHMVVFLSVDPLHASPNRDDFEVFLLTTLQFQAPRDNFVCRMLESNALYMLNGDNLFVVDFSFFGGFSLDNFDLFREHFQVGLRNHISATKLTTRSGLVDVVGACPIDRDSFFIFNSMCALVSKL